MNTPLTPEDIVNSVRVGDQSQPSVAALADGRYVLAWTSDGQDGSGNTIVAQMFSAQGERIGIEFIVNTDGNGSQSQPVVTGTADGGFAIAWTGIDTSGPAILLQRYDTQGDPVGGETLVPSSTLGTQNDPSIAGLPGGGFVVSWYSDYGNGSSLVRDVHAQVFDAVGAPVGGEITVNTTGGGSSSFETEPSVAAIQPSIGPNGLPSGGFVVVFESAGDVLGQRFDQGGVPVGPEFAVNTTLSGTQEAPQVTGLADGRYVVTWNDRNGQDGNSYGVFARVFEGDGTPVTGEIFVNVETSSVQYEQAITATSDGGFVITWSAFNSGGSGDGSSYGVISRRFDMDGTPLTGETIVNTETSGNQEQPTVAPLPNGDFVIAWQSATSGSAGDGSGSAIAQRLLGDPAGFIAAPARPEVEAMSTTRTFSEADLNVGPQRIDADGAAAISDADSTDFAGGRLIVGRLSRSVDDDDFAPQDADAQDVFGLLTGGPVSVAGGIVSVNGTAVGTITSPGTGGSDLVVALNADATAARVEILIENLSYANLSDDPVSALSVAIQLEDGDGAASDPVVVDITISPQLDAEGFVRGETRVNTVVNDAQQHPAADTLADGGYVVVWQSRNQDNPGDNNEGVFAQRYDADGVPVGAEFQVNTTIGAGQRDPDVAGLNDGGFVVVWNDDNIAGIRLNRYDAAGVRTVTELQVETESSGTQFDPKVETLTNGGYVVTWVSQASGSAGDGSANGIIAQIFNAAGAPVGGEIIVNGQTIGTQQTPEVTALSGGRFAITWVDTDIANGDGSSNSVVARVFNANGTAATGDIAVNTTTENNQSGAVIDTLANGDFVVAWRSEAQDGSSGGIYYQRFDDTGAAIGGEIRVNDLTLGNQTDPAIIALTTGGFVISWTDTSTPAPGSGSDVFAQVFDADGTRVDSQVRMNTEVSGEQNEAVMTALPDGNHVVIWRSDTSGSAGDGSSSGIFKQLVGDQAELATSAAPIISGLPGTIFLAEGDANLGARLFTAGAASLSDPDTTDFGGGSLRVTRVSTEQDILDYNAPDDETQFGLSVASGGRIGLNGPATLTVDGLNVATIVEDGQQGADLLLTFLPGASAEAIEVLLGALTYTTASDDPSAQVSFSASFVDGQGGVTAPFVFTVSVTAEPDAGSATPVGDATQVNTFTPGNQDEVAIATLSDGGWVVTWTSAGQDDDSAAVFQQRFTADGATTGGEVQVNTTEARAQDSSSVAALADGGWIVAWDGNGNGDDFGIFFQRYDSTGAPQGGETLVNVGDTGSTQEDPSVVGLPGGGFAIGYASFGLDGSNYGIGMRLYDATGTQVGAPIVVNTETSSTQQDVALTVLADGRIVATWTSQTSGSAGDGSSSGIFARVFSASGVPAGPEFRVNTETFSTQSDPSIGATADGGFVIAWADSSGQDGSGTGIAAQRFDASAVPVGGEFVVNDQRVSTQQSPSVTGLTDGRFLIAWQDFGGTVDVEGQLYSASGARIDGSFPISGGVTGSQQFPAVAALPNGNFVAAWQSSTGDGSGEGVFQQIFGDPADFALNIAPVIDGLSRDVTLSEADVNAGLVRVDEDATVAVGDLDSADFSGGRLSVSIDATFNEISQFGGQDGLAQDQLGLIAGNVGNGMVTFSGTGIGATVSVDGTVVATIASDGVNGAPLTLDLNANATPETIEAILGNLGYSNPSDDPAPLRRLQIDLSDGDGAAAQSRVIDLRISPETDSTLVDGPERIVNAHTESEQGVPDVATLSGGETIVVWRSGGQDGSGYGVFGQLYDANGAASGPEFAVNLSTVASQYNPVVTALATGGFAVAWRDDSGADGSGARVVTRTFAADTTPTSGEVQVNSTTFSTQAQPAIEALGASGYIVSFFSQDGDGSAQAVLAQTFDNTATPVGAEQVINTANTLGNQSQPAIAALVDGLGAFDGHVVVFTSDTSGAQGDGSGFGIFQRAYDATGAATGPDTLVNTLTAGNQTQPTVVGLAGGGHVIAWTDDTSDGSFNGVFARIFNVSGAPLGDAFRVNTTTNSGQLSPDVVALSDGGFVIGWEDQSGLDGSGIGVFAQRYDASGNRIDGQTRINVENSSNQSGIALAETADGFTAVFNAETSAGSGDGSSTAVVLRRFETTPPADSSPRIEDLTRLSTLFSNDVTAGARVLDDAVALVDPNGGTYAGGVLDFYYTTPVQATDQLSLAATGPVTITGAANDEVRVNGTLVGTIDGTLDGANGAGLRIDLTANADAAAVQLLIERLAFASSDTAANVTNTTRGVGVTLTDGAGGQSDPQSVFVRVLTGTDSTTGLQLNDWGVSENQQLQALPRLSEIALNAQPLVIDADVDLDDFVGASFDTGFVRLTNVFSSSDAQQLSVLNTGTGAGEIGFDGTTVTFGGTAIGTLNATSDGVDGAPLQIDLNAAATAESVEALVEALTVALNGQYNTNTVGWDLVVANGAGNQTQFNRLSAPIDRDFVTVAPASGEEVQVNTFETRAQDDPQVTALAGGGYVFVWTSDRQESNTSADGVFAQVYDAAGQKVGPEFRANDTAVGGQYDPSVIGLSTGGFVIAWSDGSGRDGSSIGVYAQRFDANGTPQGVVIQLNEETSSNQDHPQLAALDAGRFMAVWESVNSGSAGDGNGGGVFARIFDAAGVPEGGEFQVNTQTSSNQGQPSVATLPDGDVLVVWTDFGPNDGSSAGVFAQRFDAATGNPLAFDGSALPPATMAETQINTVAAGSQSSPFVASLGASASLPQGGFVVAWDGPDSSSTGIFAQIFALDGTPQGSEILVNSDEQSTQSFAAIAARPGGGFIIAWQDFSNEADNSGTAVTAQEFAADGTAVGLPFLVNSETSGNQVSVTMATLANGTVVTGWVSPTSGSAGDGSSNGVFQKLFASPAPAAGAEAPVLVGLPDGTTFDEAAVNAGLQLIDTDGALSLTDADSTDFDGGEILVSTLVTNDTALFDQLAPNPDDLGVLAGAGVTISGSTVSVGGTAIGTIDTSDNGQDGAVLRIALNGDATPERVEAVLARLGFGTQSDNPVDARSVIVQVTDGDGGSVTSAPIVLTVTPEVDRTALATGEEWQVNTQARNTQQSPAVAAVFDTGGVQIGTVSVWASRDQDRPQDGGFGVFAQLFDLNGDPIGAEFRINAHTEFDQQSPVVTGLPTGGFAVAWTDDSWAHPSVLAAGQNIGTKVIAKIFDAAGTPVSPEFVVNDQISSNQDEPTIAARGNGEIIVAYRDNGNADGSGQGVFQRAFDSAGNALGASVQVNTQTSSNQSQPSVAVLAGGNSVTVWTSADSAPAGDGSGNGLFGRLFTAAGAPIGLEFAINTTTGNSQSDPHVTGLTGGDFVVVWRDDSGNDGSGSAVIMQRFDSAGAPVGAEIRVNETALNSQYQPDIVALANGGWVVVWTDNAQDGSSEGIFGQEFAADGSRVDGEFQVNTQTSSAQNNASVAALPGGGFVVNWSSVTSGSAGDGDQNGVFQQTFWAGLSQSDAPLITGLTDLALTEAAVNAGPQQIGAALGFGDADSPDFAGGVLTVSVTQNATVQEQFIGPDDGAQDQLSLISISGVSLSGTSVLVDGTPVGTITSDGVDGAPLQITFLGAADADAVKAVLRAVSYANTSNDPEQVREIAIQLTDGDGGVVRQTMTLSIAPETDGATPVGDEVLTNSFTIDNQLDSHVGVLADGGYVIVWTSTNQDATGDNDLGIFAQRYDAAGAPVGGEILVNTVTIASQSDAEVVGLANGGFVVAWRDTSRASSSHNDEEVVFQVFDALGQRVGGETAHDSATSQNPFAPALAAFDAGGFVMVHHAQDRASPFGNKILGQRYDDTGSPVGTEFEIAQPGGNSAANADVAAQADGTFAVVFQEQALDESGANNSGVFLQRFAADGTALGLPVTVNQIVRFDQFAPRIAALDGGGYVVVFESDIGDDFSYTSTSGIYGQVFTSGGAPIGEQFLVNRVVDSSQTDPDVAATDGGGFAVTYTDQNGTDGSGRGVYVQQYDAAGNRIDGPVQVNVETSSTQDDASIAALPGGNFVVSFTSNTSATAGDGNSGGVFHRLIGDPADFNLGAGPVLDGVNRTVTYSENLLNGLPQLIDENGAAAVSHPTATDFDGGSILVSNVLSSAPLIDQINAPDDLTQDQLGLRQADGITISGTAVSIDGTLVATILQDGQNGSPFELRLNANATPELVERLVENLTYRNISDDPLPTRELRIQVTDGDGGASAPSLVTLTIDPTPDAAVAVGGERVINTTDTGSESAPKVAGLPNTGGDFIAVFESGGADGSGGGLLAQRFDSLGNPVARDGTGLASGVTDEFRINTVSTSSNQFDADVAAFSNGGWVVVWSDSTIDSSSTGVAAKIFNPDGTPLDGTEFIVPSLTSSTQDMPSVAVLTNDRFVVTWESVNSGGASDGDSQGVLGRLFEANGTPVAGQFVVNTTTAGSQGDPSITALADGGFLVTWEDRSAADGSSNGIFAQRFDANANALGTEFRINTTTANSQSDPVVTALNNGNIVVVWEDSAADQSSTGVFAQIYDVTGTAVTDEFRVNDQRISTQFDPVIASLDTGGFVIAWTDNNGTDGSGQGVFAQQYDAAGNRLDSQFQVNTTFLGTQNQPDITGLPGGGFVVAFNGSTLLQVYGNDAPVLSPISATGAEDTAIVLDAALFDAGFTDPNGNTLQSVRIDTFPNDGTLTLSGTPVVAGQEISRADLIAGNLVYLGNQDFNGADSFQWTGSDGISFAPTAVQADITVTPVNDAPGLEAGTDATLGEGQTLTRQITLTDPDFDTRSFTVDYGDGSALQTFNSTSLTPNLSHVYGSEGSFTVTVTVDDNSGAANAFETDSFTVTVINAAPITGPDNFIVNEDGPAGTGNVLTNDSDPGGDPISVSAVNGQGADVGVQLTLLSGALLTIDAAGNYTYDPNGAFEGLADFQNGFDSFSYTVTDGLLETSRTVNVTIDGQNDAPVAGDDTATVNDTATVTLNLLTNDTDVDTANTVSVTGFDGTVSGVSDLGGGVFQGTVTATGALVTLDTNTGDVTYDPNGALSGGGSDSFGYLVSDGRGGTDSATVNITVNGTNQNPVAGDDLQIVTEDVNAFGAPLFVGSTGPDSDPDGDTITVVTVNGLAANVGTNLLLGSGATLNVAATGTFSYLQNGVFNSLAVGETGNDSFTYTISDGNGGSDTATVTIEVQGVNDAPVALNDSASTDQNTAISGIGVLGNDSDVDSTDTLAIDQFGGVAAVPGASVAGAGGGLFSFNANGTFDYDPNGAFDSLAQGSSGTDSVSYRVSDGNGGTDIATLFVTVSGLNDGPDAVDDGFAVGKTATLTGLSVTANDTDPDSGDSLFVSLINGTAAVGTQITLSSGALLQVNAGGTFSYDPNGQFDSLQNGQSATDSFTYTLSDALGQTDTATVTLTINGSSTPPVAAPDSATTDEDTATDIAVLGNDTDADGDLLSVTTIEGSAAAVGVAVALGSGATATLNADGTVTYDPNGAFEALAAGGPDGTDSFSYTIGDGTGGSDTATVSVTITGVNDAPVAANDSVVTDEETGIAINVLANNGGGVDTDPDAGTILVADEVNGGALAIGASVLLTSGALVTRDASASFTYDPNGAFESLSAGSSAGDSFTYRLSDGQGGTDLATVFVTVNGVNDAPDAAADTFAVAVGAALSGNVLANDTDIDSLDALAVVGVQGGINLGTPVATDNGGLVTLTSTGVFSYDQNGAFAGLGAGQSATDTFAYQISDGNGGIDTATVTITVGGSNLPPVGVDDTATANEDGPAILVDALNNDTDPNADPLAVSGVDTTGTLGLVTDNGDGTFGYDPNGAFEALAAGEQATDSFTYTVDDGQGGSDTATVTVAITGQNDAPVA
ncbi:hypothetical protein DKT77_00335, partial [Meridianimarinicoccus roseus]